MSLTVRLLALSASVVLCVAPVSGSFGGWSWFPDDISADAAASDSRRQFNVLRPQRRSFENIGCQGFNYETYWRKLDLLCNNCYQIYADVTIYNKCTRNCFTNEYFRPCVDTLQEQEYYDTYLRYITYLNGSIDDGSYPAPPQWYGDK